MIVGLGIDLVEIARIRSSLERFGEHFLKKILHNEERERLLLDNGLTSPGAVASIAARFAAKEAGVKALGTGFAEGITLHDLRVLSLPSGQPQLHLHGKAKERAATMGASAVFLSLTHSKTTAGAVVVLESR